MLAMIACMTIDGVIGNDGKIPWTCSDDMARFKQLTWGDNVVMGHKTAKSLKGPLPGRTNYVVSPYAQPEGFYTVSPLLLLSRLREWRDAPEVTWIIGGGQLYRETIGICSLLHLTILHDDYEGDTTFPVALMEQFFVQKERRAFADGAFTTWYRKDY